VFIQLISPLGNVRIMIIGEGRQRDKPNFGKIGGRRHTDRQTEGRQPYLWYQREGLELARLILCWVEVEEEPQEHPFFFIFRIFSSCGFKGAVA
jgi:hypothetical protein